MLFFKRRKTDPQVKRLKLTAYIRQVVLGDVREIAAPVDMQFHVWPLEPPMGVPLAYSYDPSFVTHIGCGVFQSFGGRLGRTVIMVQGIDHNTDSFYFGGVAVELKAGKAVGFNVHVKEPKERQGAS